MGIGWSDQFGIGYSEEEAAQSCAQSIADMWGKIVYPYYDRNHFYAQGCGVHRLQYTNGVSEKDLKEYIKKSKFVIEPNRVLIMAKPIWVQADPYPCVAMGPLLKAGPGAYDVHHDIQLI